MHVRLGYVAALGLLLSTAGPLRGGTPFHWDQTDFAVANSERLSSSVSAADFIVTTTARLDAADIWLSDDVLNDNGALDSFSGLLSWAIYSNSGGNPGTLLFSGRDSTVGRADTGLQDAFGYDIVRARFEFDGRVVLPPGTYWLALHEGAWGAAGDGSELWWQIHSNIVGSPARYSVDESTPGSWLTGLGDQAFALFGGPLAWQQGAVAGGAAGTDVSGGVTANDFTLAAATHLGSLDAWIMDLGGIDNGYGDAFSEVLSWAVYTNSAGAPGTVVASGSDSTPQIEDSGLTSADGDLLRVRIELRPSLTLGPGTYWLALHEGLWLQAFDGSGLAWADSTLPLGVGQWYDPNETSPAPWDTQLPYESAFVLFDDPIFASGFERGSTLAWLSMSDSTCRQGTDTDNDRLDDCFESNTGRFVDVRNTGSNPANADTDGDGIEDGDETLGTLAGLNLPAMGTNPLKKNILLEYDWFNDGLECAAHSHRPTAAALAAVTAMFAGAPNGNPDGTTGIHFIHDYGQGGAFTGGNLIADPDGVIAGGVSGTEYLAHKAANFAANRNGYFHYTLLPHRYNTTSGSSGQAEVARRRPHRFAPVRWIRRQRGEHHRARARAQPGPPARRQQQLQLQAELQLGPELQVPVPRRRQRLYAALERRARLLARPAHFAEREQPEREQRHLRPGLPVRLERHRRDPGGGRFRHQFGLSGRHPERRLRRHSDHARRLQRLGQRQFPRHQRSRLRAPAERDHRLRQPGARELSPGVPGTAAPGESQSPSGGR